MKDRSETIKKFLEQMSTQDNRGTAFPIFYVVLSSRWAPTAEGCGDRTRYANKEYYEDIISQEEWEKLPETKEDIEGELDKDSNELLCQEDYDAFDEKIVWDEHRMFLTETDAERWLKDNAHNLSPDAHTYVKCAKGADEFVEFLLALFEHFGVQPRKDLGTM